MGKFDDISDPFERRLADGLGRLAAVSRQLDWQAAESEGLSPTQADILHFISSRPEGVRLAAAAAHAGIRSATASDAISALERKAHVRKHKDATDGRAIILKVTRKGRALVQRWPASFEPVVEGLDTSEQEQLLRLVIKMIHRLQDRSLIAPQRTCATCIFFRENITPDTTEPHFCAFVGAPMADRHLRVDCPEHESIAA